MWINFGVQNLTVCWEQQLGVSLFLDGVTAARFGQRVLLLLAFLFE